MGMDPQHRPMDPTPLNVLFTISEGLAAGGDPKVGRPGNLEGVLSAGDGSKERLTASRLAGIPHQEEICIRCYTATAPCDRGRSIAFAGLP